MCKVGDGDTLCVHENPVDGIRRLSYCDRDGAKLFMSQDLNHFGHPSTVIKGNGGKEPVFYMGTYSKLLTMSLSSLHLRIRVSVVSSTASEGRMSGGGVWKKIPKVDFFLQEVIFLEKDKGYIHTSYVREFRTSESSRGDT